MSLNKKDKYFTLILVSGIDSKIRQIKIHYNWLRSVFIVAGVIVVLLVTLASNVYLVRNQLDNKVVELSRLQEKISYKEVEVANLKTKSNEIVTKTKVLEDYLAQVQNLDKMVRDITGKGGYENQVSVYVSDLSANVDLQNDTNEIFYYDYTDAEDLNSINDILDNLIAQVPAISAKLTEDKKHMEDHIYLADHTPSIWPTSGVVSGTFNEWRGNHRHGGVDIATDVGTDVHASAAGVVIFAGRNQGFGNEIIVHHGFGMTTVYAHLNKILVAVGDEVAKNQKIAESGNTGNSTGPHLHYEVIKDNSEVDPMSYLP
jgi:Membrane proteins related to metalloendopeptidases